MRSCRGIWSSDVDFTIENRGRSAWIWVVGDAADFSGAVTSMDFVGAEGVWTLESWTEEGRTQVKKKKKKLKFYLASVLCGTHELLSVYDVVTRLPAPPLRLWVQRETWPSRKLSYGGRRHGRRKQEERSREMSLPRWQEGS